MDHNQQGGGQGRRGHFHRGRRGSDRRGHERRHPAPAQSQAAEAAPQTPREHVDVEQIMRDIRSRIGQASGLELSNAQIQELAARRLEAVLDPQSLNPALLDRLRAATGSSGSTLPRPARVEPKPFDAGALFKKIFGPILRLFFNPEPIAAAFDEQSRLAAEAAAREAERDRVQAEWNALHYELLRRVVREAARNSIEVQALVLQVESLAAKVDFNERRVRGIEGAVHQPQPRHAPRQAPVEVAVPAVPADAAAAPGSLGVASLDVTGAEGPRRRRRRRRGRRGTGPFAEGAAPNAEAGTMADEAGQDADEGGDADDPMPETAQASAPEPPAPVPGETVHGGAVHAAEPAAEPVFEPASEPPPLRPADEPVDR